MNEKKFTPHIGRKFWFLKYVETEDQFIPDEREWTGDDDDRKMLAKHLIYRNEILCWQAANDLNKMLNNYRSNLVTE